MYYINFELCYTKHFNLFGLIVCIWIPECGPLHGTSNFLNWLVTVIFRQNMVMGFVFAQLENGSTPRVSVMYMLPTYQSALYKRPGNYMF